MKRCLLLVICVNIPAFPTVYQTIANLYLPSFNPGPSCTQDASPFTVEKLTPQEQRSVAFRLFETSPQHPYNAPSLLEEKTWEDLELYTGANLLSVLDRTKTKFGEVALAGLLARPTNSIVELSRRQRIIRAILDNKNLFGLLSKVLAAFPEVEPVLLALWQHDQNAQDLSSALYVPDYVLGASYANRSPLALELIRCIEDTGAFWIIPSAVLSLFYLKRKGIVDQVNQYLKNPPTLSYSWNSIEQIFDFSYGVSFVIHNTVGIPISLYLVLQHFRYNYQTLKYVYCKLQFLSAAFDRLKNTYVVLTKHKKELAELNECQPIIDFFEKPSGSLAHLTTLLKSSAFNGPFSYITHFPHMGSLLAAHTLAHQVKEEIKPALVALGYLDSYVSIATLMREQQLQKNSYCFAQFSNATAPALQFTEFWNPLLTHTETIVLNDLTLGLGSARSIIVTGQNTGGKSTIIKGAVLTAILAQTLGIAPAKYVRITPFSYLGTYITVKDNVSEGKSLLASEIDHAKHILNILEKTKDQKSLVVIDESFKGAGGEAEDLSHWYALKLASYPACICLQATHCPQLTKLEQETDAYLNYKVEVTETDGRLHRTYKLIRGISLHSIAHLILVEEGLK